MTASRSRTAPKRPAPGKGYPEATRAKVVAQLEADGMAATHAATGIPKTTLGRWARAAGVDLGDLARARTASATATRVARSAEVAASTVDLLEQHIGQAGHFLGVVAGINAAAADAIIALDPDLVTMVSTLAGPVPVVTDKAVADLVKIAKTLESLPLAVRDAEGMVTRAIHDLQLLRGEATERGEVVVEFAVPRPIPSATVVVEHPRPPE